MAIIDRLSYFGRMMRADPLNFIVYMLYTAASILLALILHEVAHGWVAYRCGDPTAKMLGRLSLNPAKHLDPIGTICMVFIGFGWARPVPVNPRNFRNYRRDDFLVSIAGIVTNFLLFLLSVSLLAGLTRALWRPEFVQANSAELLMSPYYSPMATFVEEGLKGTLPGLNRPYSAVFRNGFVPAVARFLAMFSQMNLCLAIFNLLPIPPLDGYHLVNDTLLKGRLNLNSRAFQITQGLLMILLFTGVLNGFLSKANFWVYERVLNLMLKLAGLA